MMDPVTFWILAGLALAGLVGSLAFCVLAYLEIGRWSRNNTKAHEEAMAFYEAHRRRHGEAKHDALRGSDRADGAGSIAPCLTSC